MKQAIRSNDKPVVIRALLQFLSFSPWKIIALNIATLLGSLSTVLGIFLVIPLAQIAGINFDSQVGARWGLMSHVAKWLNQFNFTKDLTTILFIYVLLAIALALLSYKRTLIGAKLQQDYTKQMRMQLYEAVLSSKWEYLSNRRSSRLLHRLGTQVQSMNATAHQIITLLHKLLSLLVLTVFMVVLNWKFTVMTFAVAFLVAIAVFPVRWSIRKAGKEQVESYQNIFQLLAEHLSSLKMIKSSGHEWMFYKKLRKTSSHLEKQQLKVAQAGAIIALAHKVALTLGFSIILYSSITWLNIPVSHFFLLLVIMSRIFPQVAGLQQSIQQITFTLPIYQDLEKTFANTAKMHEAKMSKNKSKMQLHEGLEFKKVEFSYPNSSNNVLKNLSFVIPKNKIFALVGASGAGKTTVADLLVGLLIPNKGQVLVDNQVLERSQLARWRRSIAYVTQDSYFFNDTIRNNLNWVADNITDEAISDALEKAVLTDFIKKLPKGLDTVIGERGIRLSGGERQRLALARAFLTKPQLLILDEATSALDIENERQIVQAISNIKGDLTIVVIAHRLSTIKHADKVLYLKEPSKSEILTPQQVGQSIAIG